MNSTPYEMQAYDKAYKIRRVQEDERDWMMGQYMLSAIGTVMSSAFSKHSKAKYVEEPFLHKLLDDTDDSQDVERYEKKAMAEMQVYIGLLNSQNELPQTVFKDIDIKKET
jgi:hypothetical protein